MTPFEINFLDHVAIYVEDMDTSIKWYSEVLGLKTYQFEKWGEFPVFMLSGKTGVAIFPAKLNEEKLASHPPHIKIDHFAFNVLNKDFIKAQEHFNHLSQEFTFQDHHYFHSIYLKDPDNHTVELTTIMVDDANFYT